MKTFFPSRPVPKKDIPILLHIKQVYAALYQIGNKLPKRDKLGIHAEIERIVIELLSHAIRASFAPKPKKIEPLENVRILIETTKHLVRTEYELKIIDQKTYIRIEYMLVDASKMTNGWLKFLAPKNPAG